MVNALQQNTSLMLMLNKVGYNITCSLEKMESKNELELKFSTSVAKMASKAVANGEISVNEAAIAAYVQHENNAQEELSAGTSR